MLATYTEFSFMFNFKCYVVSHDNLSIVEYHLLYLNYHCVSPARALCPTSLCVCATRHSVQHLISHYDVLEASLLVALK